MQSAGKRTDKVTRGRGLAGVDVADNDEIDVVLLLAHCSAMVGWEGGHNDVKSKTYNHADLSENFQ